MNRTYIARIFLSLIFMFFWSCSGEENIEPEGLQQFEIAQGFLASNEIIPQQSLVINTVEEWEELKLQMQEVRGNVLELFSETNVDFSEFRVIAIFDEIRPHTGYYIEVSEILEKESSFEINIEKGNSLEGYHMLSQPFYLARISRHSKPVTFE